MKATLKSILFLGTLVLTSIAQALTINDINDDFTINWSKSIDASHTLQATASFNVTSFTNTQTIFDITVSNMTNPGNYQAAISAVGFYTDTQLTGAVLTNNATGATWGINTSGVNFSGGFQNIDVCLFAANNCHGGAINQGLQNGQTDSFTLTLSYLSAPALVISSGDNFPVKFQTQNDSFQFGGTTTSGCTVSGCTQLDSGNVPEPSVSWLLGAGLLGFTGFTRRRSLSMFKVEGLLSNQSVRRS